ncbi:MAG: hypothetical protein AAFS12_11385 [Cyanobacteria bacterium J06632_19]
MLRLKQCEITTQYLALLNPGMNLNVETRNPCVSTTVSVFQSTRFIHPISNAQYFYSATPKKQATAEAE